MKRISTMVAAGALLLALSAPTADATLQLGTGLIDGSGDVDNVVFNPCGLGGSIGTTVQGCLNSDHTELVNFTSTEPLLIGEGGGQATITGATDGNFTDFSIALADPTKGFSKLQLSLDTFLDGQIHFTALDQFGTTFDFGTYALDGSGLNKFTLYSTDAQVALSFSGFSTIPIDDLSDLEQVRIGEADTTTKVPESTSLALLGGGLFGLGLILRRRSNS